nr:ATP-grasp domain-containing protein [uncultured Sellimonas sp.]
MRELENKRLLILGGSRISCQIVQCAHDLGITVGVTDWYPLEKSPAKQIADEQYYVSTADVDAIVKLIIEKKFDGVITGFTDSVLPYYAEICDKAGLPCYGTKDQFEVFIDKSKYKKLLRKYDIPTIPEYQIDLNDIEGSLENVKYPLLVKPSDSSGARGISICYNSDELKEAINVANGASKTQKILVEQYIDGAECTAFWLFVNGNYYLTMLGNRHVKYNQDGVIPLPVGYTFPAKIQPEFIQEIAPKMKEMFQGINIQNGMMFMQCKISNGTCLVYDIGYRLTGSLEYINLKEICGYNPMEMLINFALTGSMGEPDIGNKVDPYFGGHYAYNVSLLCKPGKIATILGLKDIKSLPGVIDTVVAHPEGDEITEKMKGLLAQITVRILGKADSINNMEKEMLKIQNIAHIISDEGEEMILPGLEDIDFEGTIYE